MFQILSQMLLFFVLILSLCSCEGHQISLDKTNNEGTRNNEITLNKTSATLNGEQTPAPESLSTLTQTESLNDAKNIHTENLNNEVLFEKIMGKEFRGMTSAVSKYCDKVDREFFKFGWGKSHCRHFEWIHVRNSVLGDPLIWAVYGDENRQKDKKLDVTMIFCGVHGDEITPIKFCFDILYHMERIINDIHHGKADLKNKLVIISPIVNPDSFFKAHPTRTNARKVDINRNFPTKDWNRLALKMWKDRYKSDHRRFPGMKSLSEPEVLFQMNLIRRYSPTKIISIHAPLTILDYDGPLLGKNKHDHIAIGANELLIQMSKQASDYRIKNYPFFPGSLGNWAGNERGIPTYTLELPTSDNRQNKKYWKLFKEAIHTAILHDFKKSKKIAKFSKSEKSNLN